jgi:hypothetical protein
VYDLNKEMAENLRYATPIEKRGNANSTGGEGVAQYNDGKPVDAVGLGGCVACHVPVKACDLVFTKYAP